MRTSNLRLTLLAVALTGMLFTTFTGCSDDENPLTTDQTAPLVNFISPADDATSVPLNTSIAATFNEAMTASTVSASSFTLKYGATAVAGAVTYSGGLGATFSPGSLLLPNTVYTAMISTGAEDLAGNGLATNYSWTFTTGATIDATPPIVASTLPLNAATQVATNAAISAVFSEPIDPTTLSGTSVYLKQGATSVAGAVSYSGNTVVFTPAAALANSSVYTATITSAVTDLSGNILVQPKVWSFTTVAATDGIAPTVVSVVPANAASAIAVSANITATFSEAMNAVTISASTFTLAQGASAVSGVVSYNGLVATFNPTNNLVANVTYTATITAGATDAAGNALAVAYVWTFTTSVSPDVVPPTVTTTIPANGASNVLWGSNVTVVFSEAMNPPTISTATFQLMQGNIRYDGVVSYSGNTLTFNPTSDLAPGTLYTATVLTGATDLAGNGLVANYTWTFTTIHPVPPPDVTRPTVLVTVPANNASSVATSITVSVAFSENVTFQSISGSTFTLRQGANLIAGVVEYFGTAASFNPTVALSELTVYTATLTTGITDHAGNAMAADYSWSFTTGGAVNTDVPIVLSVTPENEAIDVATVASITATFSEPMNPASLTTSTFKLTDGTGLISGSVSYSGRTATFNPVGRLTPNTLYNGTITTGATDGSGNGLASDFEWIFITEPVPEVTGVVPTVDGLNVAISSKVAASFTKPMNPSSLTTESFIVRLNGNWVPGVVSTVGAAVVFDPSGNLSANSVYTAEITTAATDVSGNPLPQNVVWSFTTGSNVDASGVIVTASDPAAGATNVPRGGTIRAYFSDAIDPTTLTTSSFTVAAGANHAVGVVSYPETIAIFTPSVLLAPSTVYTVTMTSAVKDISGNSLTQKVWTFTTRP